MLEFRNTSTTSSLEILIVNMPIATSTAIAVVDSYKQYVKAIGKLGGLSYHQASWRKAFGAYGLQTHWLVANKNEKPVGLLPLVRQSSRLFGHRLVSLPWVDEAGALGDEDAIAALLKHSAQLAGQFGKKFSVLIKQPILSKSLAELPGWSRAEGDKVLMWRRLEMPARELWDEFSPKVRNQIRKAEKNGLSTERGGAELVEEFYQVYSQNMRDLGSPSHSLLFFRTLFKALGKRANIYCARLDGVAIGAGFVIDNRPSLDIPWASSLLAYNRLCVNHSLYWKVLSDACEADYKRFHFGRSSVGSGQHKFKKQWGAEEVPLGWLEYSQDLGHTTNNNPAVVKEKFGLAQRAWIKLPLWVSQHLGPHIIRHAP